MIRKIKVSRQMIVLVLIILFSAGNNIVMLTEILPKYPNVKKSKAKSAAFVDAYKSKPGFYKLSEGKIFLKY